MSPTTVPRSTAMQSPTAAPPPLCSCCVWRRPPESLALTRDDVHVWRIALDLPQRLALDLLPLLSCEDKAGAERFLCAVALNGSIVSHGATRRILSRYLHKTPEGIRLSQVGGASRTWLPLKARRPSASVYLTVRRLPCAP